MAIAVLIAALPFVGFSDMRYMEKSGVYLRKLHLLGALIILLLV